MRVGGRRRPRWRGRRRCGGAERARRRRWGPRRFAAGEMSVCSEHLVLISARARTRRRTTRLLFLSYGEKASFPWPEPLSAAQPMHAQKSLYARLWPPCSRAHEDGRPGSPPNKPASPPHASHAPPKDASRVPMRMPIQKKTKKHQAREASEAARPSPNEPPQTSLKPGPSLRAPLLSRLRDRRL